MTRDTNDSGQPFAALNRLFEDRERFVAAEKSAELEKKGLWALPQHEEVDGEKAAAAMGMDGGTATGLIERSAGIVRALSALFGRRR